MSIVEFRVVDGAAVVPRPVRKSAVTALATLVCVGVGPGILMLLRPKVQIDNDGKIPLCTRLRTPSRSVLFDVCLLCESRALLSEAVSRCAVLLVQVCEF